MDKTTTPLLHSYVAKGEVEAVINLIAQGADVNEQDEGGDTPLHRAVENKRKRIAEILLEAGADLNIYGDQWKPADLAVEHKDLIMIKILLKGGASINSSQYRRSGAYIIHIAAEYADISLIKYLLKRGVEVDSTDYYSNTPLHYCTHNCQRKAITAAQILLSKGADICAKNSHGNTALHEAASRFNFNFIRFLIIRQIPVDIKNSNGETPLTLAIKFFDPKKKNKIKTIQTLINFGADVNNVDYTSTRTILNRACKRSIYNTYINPRITFVLLKNGADVNALDHDGHSPLMYFTRHFTLCVPESLLLLLEYGANVNIVASDKSHVLHNINNEKFVKKCYCKEIILKHIAMLQALKRPINPVIMAYISQVDDFNGYFIECTQEVSKAKNTRLENCWITFFNLLIDDEEKLVKYAGNGDYQRYIDEDKLKKKFPIFGKRMYERMFRSMINRKIWDFARNKLSAYLPIFNPTHLIIHDILDCLNKQDWREFFNYQEAFGDSNKESDSDIDEEMCGDERCDQ